MATPPLIYVLNGPDLNLHRWGDARPVGTPIVGFGPLGYLLALDADAQLCKGAAAKATRQVQ